MITVIFLQKKESNWYLYVLMYHRDKVWLSLKDHGRGVFEWEDGTYPLYVSNNSVLIYLC